MRTRERERFLRMNFTEKELNIRNWLYKNKKLAKYKIIITQENYKKSDSLAYFSDYPEEGKYVDTIYFYNPDQYLDILKLYEGLFYQLFDLESGEIIGPGMLDPDSPVEEIREFEGKTCGRVCQSCWWRGLLYDEKRPDERFYCYNSNEKESEVR